MALSGKSSGMSFAEWVKKKKEEGGTTSPSAPSSSSETSAKSNTNDSSLKGKSSGISFDEWIKKKRASSIGSSFEDWGNEANSLINEINNFHKTWHSEDDEAYTSYEDRISKLFVAANDWRSKYSSDEKTISYINDVVSRLEKLQDYNHEYKSQYSKYKTEDEYKKAVKAQEDYESMVKFDLIAGQKEIDELEKQLKNMPTPSYDARGTVGQANAQAASKAIKNLEAKIAEKKAYYSRAKRIQDGIKLTNDAKNAVDFEENSKYVDNVSYGLGGKPRFEDETYAYINNPTVEDKRIGGGTTNARSIIEGTSDIYNFENPWSDGESSSEENALDYLTDEEVAIYNYYYATGGKKKAEEYLENIQETIRYRKAKEDFDKIEGNTFAELLFGVEAGVDQFASGMQNLFNFEDDYIVPTVTQMTSGMVREDLDDTGAKLPEWLGGGSIGQVGYDLINTTSNMLPSILTSTAIGFINPAAGSAIGAALMGASASGNAYAEMLNLGYDKGQARLYSGLVGVSEASLQYLLGGIGKLGGGTLTTKAVVGIANNMDNAFARIAIKLGANAAGEFTEEYLQEVLTPFFKNLTLNTSEDIKLFSTEALYSGMLGALSAGVLEGGSTISSDIKTTNLGKNVQSIDGGVQRLKELGTTFAADTVAYQIADKVTEETGAYKIGLLLQEVGGTLSEQNVSDIVAELTKKGMDEKSAKTIARSYQAFLNKEMTLTDEQVETLENLDPLADVLRKSIIGSNTTIYQRTREYSDLVKLATETIENPNPDATIDDTSAKGVVSPVYSTEYVDSVVKEFEAMGIPTESARILAENQLSVSTEGNSTPTTKNIVESEYEVSAEGKTINRKTDKIVNVKNFAEISKNGKVKLTIDDGLVVEASDLAYGSDAEALFIENISKIKIGKNPISTTSANALYMKAMKALEKNPDMTASEAMSLIKGLEESYIYGTYNLGRSKLTARDESGKARLFAGELSQDQRAYAYDLGAKDRVSEVERDQKVIDTLKAKAEGKPPKKSLGKVVFEKGAEVSDESELTETQRVNLEGIKLLAELSSVEFHIFRSDKNNKFKYTMANGKVTTANGWFVAGTNQIWVDLNAGNAGEGTMIRTAAHEISHYIKRWSPQKWRAMADLLMKSFAENDVDTESMLNRQIDKIKRRYNKKNMPSESILRDMAYEELVSDALSDMLTDGSIVNFIAEVKSKDRNLWQKIGDAIKSLLKKWGLIVDSYKGRDLETAEAQALSQLEDTFKKLQGMYQEAFVDANETVALVSDIVNIDVDSESVSPMLSERTWTESEYVTEREKTAKAISSTLGVDIDTAYKYIDDINSVARLIADDRVRLDYDPNIDEGATVLKKNSEYKYSVDMSTLCAKRLLTTGTFDAIQRRLPNKVFSSEDIVALREMMLERGYEVACGICYVESTRREMGRITQDFIDSYIESQKTGKPITRTNSKGKIVDLKKTKDEMLTTADKSANKFYADKSYTPTLADLNTTDIDLVKKEHPLVYEAYLNFMNARGQAKPKLLETRAEYKGEILKHFKTSSSVNARNNAGGLRLQSFSDFEVPHLIDMMQIVMDMSRVGLKSQAYTKVPAFAEVFGNTGVKINLSLIAKDSGLDANGNLIFDDVEGINHNEAFKLRDKFSKNVGTILVGKNDAHIIAAMADPRIDYIIPFHKSSWKESLYEALGLTGYADYTDFQNEKSIDGSKISNYDPSEYWDFTKSGDENAQIYLEKCREDGRIPKFPQFQGYPGYWKLLIDFKMYDNDGVGSPQEVVNPTFEMDAAEKILNEYKGGHRNFPVAKDVVEDFVNDYGKDVMFSEREIISESGTNYGIGVYLDSDVLSGLTDSQRKDKVKDFVVNKLAGRHFIAYDSNNNAINVGIAKKNDTIKNKKGKKRQVIKELYNKYNRNTIKQEAIVLMDEIIGTAKFSNSLPSAYSHDWLDNNGKNDWEYWKVFIQEKNKTVWEATLNIATTTNGKKILYDIDPIKKVEDAIKSASTTTDGIIHQNDSKSQELFSERDTEGNELSKGQQEFFKESKVRDSEGNLTPVYHGTPSGGFTVFQLPHYLSSLTSAQGAGYYFTDKKNAQQYMKGLNGKSVSQKALYKVYLNITNPLEISEYSTGAISDDAFRRVMARGNYEWGMSHIDVEKRLQVSKFDSDRLAEMVRVFNGDEILTVMKEELGYDGVRYTDKYGDIWVAWDKSQIKNTTNENPTTDPDIRYSERDLAPAFYSQMGKVVEGVKQEKLAANSVVNLLRGKGVKAEEIRWSGIVPFLEGKKSVTKQELLDFINGSMIQIGEQVAVDEKDAEIVLWQSPQSDVKVLYIDEKKEDIFRRNEYGQWVSDAFGDVFFDEQEILDQVKSDYARTVANTNWSQYKLDGGSNYREIVFTLPNSSYSNRAMKVHWGNDAEGILVHARIQDFNVNGKKMLFIEEIQSDWHNEGHSKGYSTKEYEDAVESQDKLYNEYKKFDLAFHKYVRSNEFMTDPEDVRKKKYDWLRGKVDTAQKKYLDAEKIVNNLKEKGAGNTPDAPFKDNYHEYVLKRLLRMAAEEGYDSIGWTPADIQSKRWSDEFAEGYRIEYDQEMPKFLRKYGKQWGATVGSSVLKNGTEIWSMDITDSMKNSVLYEGQVMYSERDTDSSNRSILANALEGTAQNDVERNKLAQYKEKISLIEAEEKRLSEIQKQLFTKGAVEPAQRKELQFEAKQISNRINTYDRQLLNLESTTALKNVLNREKALAMKRQKQKDNEALAKYKEKVAKTQRELLDKHKESRKKAIESREKTAMRHKIKSVVNDLNSLLLKPTKERHVPEEMRIAVAEALSVVNMDTVAADERVAKYNDLIAKAKDPDIIASLTETRDRILNQGNKLADKLAKLKDAYGMVRDSTDDTLRSMYDDVIYDKIESVQRLVGKTPLRNMTLSQLESVYELYKMVLTTIRASNSAFAENIKMTRLALGSNTFAEIKENNKARDRIKHESAEKFLWQNLKPMQAMKKIGSGTLQKLWNNILYGQEVFAVDYDEAVKFAKEMKEKYGYKKWNLNKLYSFESKSGKKMKINLEQMMSIYAYSKRQQADDHIEYGGIVLNEGVIKEKNKLGKTVEVKVNDSTAYRLNKMQVGEIISTLEKEFPGAKDFVDEMQKYLSETMGAKGNEVSMKMYGINLFKEEHYFPLKSSKDFMEAANAKLKGDVKIKNKGMTKSTVEHARNPIVLENFLDVWGNHINEMALYHGLVLPLEDFSRTLNYSFKADENLNSDAESVRTALHDAFGDNADNYLNELLKAINGGVLHDSSAQFADKMISKFKKAKVMASLSVIVQQPTAIIRSMAIIDPKYFVAQKLNHKTTWEELKKYCPTAIIKETGSFDTNMGRTIVDMVKDDRGFIDKVGDVLGKAPAFMDEVGWNMIWRALKKKVAVEQKLSGEALLQECGKQMTLILNETQVYDSVLARNELMRSKNTLTKMATAFMAEPSTVANMVYGAALDFKRGKKGMATKTVAATITSVVVNGLVSALVYAMRDDDEEKTWLEKYLSSATTEVLDGLNPLTYIPFVKDAYSLFQGYKVERTDMALISDVVDAINKFYNVLNPEAYEGMSKDEIAMYIYENSVPMLTSICDMFGLPVGNILRDAEAIIVNDNVPLSQSSSKGMGYALKEGVLSALPKIVSNVIGTDSKQDKLYDAIVDGDTAYIERLKSGYKDDKAYETAVRKALRDNDPRIKEAAEARIAGNIAEYTRIVKEIKAEGHFSQDTIVASINAEINAINKGESSTSESSTENKASSMYKIEDYYDSIVGGDQASAYVVKEDIINTDVTNGKDREEAENSFYSRFASCVREQYEDGYITGYEAQRLLVNYGNKSEDESYSKVQYWEFKSEYPDYDDLSEESVTKYYKDVQPYGISVDVYYDYYKQRANCKGTDNNGDGKTDSGSKKAEILQVIHSLPLTSAQKDALYYINGWSAKTIYEAPWH